jgi:hypothetical protein
MNGSTMHPPYEALKAATTRDPEPETAVRFRAARHRERSARRRHWLSTHVRLPRPRLGGPGPPPTSSVGTPRTNTITAARRRR